MVYILMTAHWGLPAPNLVVSVVSGEGRTKLKTWVREVIRQGLVKASQSTGEHTAVAYHFSNSPMGGDPPLMNDRMIHL